MIQLYTHITHLMLSRKTTINPDVKALDIPALLTESTEYNQTDNPSILEIGPAEEALPLCSPTDSPSDSS